MSSTAYIAAAWVGTFVTIAAYAAWILRRGRRMSKLVDESDRRWM
jgi:hypothetical protein